MHTRGFVGAVLMVVACSSGPGQTQAQCNQIANDIRRQVPLHKDSKGKEVSSLGICTNTDPKVVADFGQACDALKACNADCCK